MLIPKYTSVLIRRVPGLPCKPIVTTPPLTDQDKYCLEPLKILPVAEKKLEDVKATKCSFTGADLSVSEHPDEQECDEFGNDFYTMPEVAAHHLSSPVQCAPLPNKADEDSKIKALFHTPALDWQCQNPDCFAAGRGLGRAMGDKSGGRGFGRGGLLEQTTPPPGYVCLRCKISGHFIQHCPTNGDPAFDIKRVKPPTGIPKSMLMATNDGSYSLPSDVVAVLKPNERCKGCPQLVLSVIFLQNFTVLCAGQL
ncbi:E3 ubiquitin ligase PQT3-like isoform X1 [Apium graveolens]|uniref:E3 ubiquitin ligase PQT3-like isoform X1 n=1 Tax=Apium graveolens TaxID=4045 RepID=UPI003D791375